MKLCDICKALRDKREGTVARAAAPAPSAPEPSGCPIERSRNPAPPRAHASPEAAAPKTPRVSIHDCDLCSQTIRRIEEKRAAIAEAVAAAEQRRGKAKNK